MKTIINLILTIVVILILVVVVGVIIKFTNGGTTNFKTFYLVTNEHDICENSTYILLDGDNHFETKYVFISNTPEEHKGYNLSIVPNVRMGKRLEFSVDGKKHLLEDIKDFSTAFEIEQEMTGFTIHSDGKTIEEIIIAMYDGQNVVFEEHPCGGNTPYINLVVSSYNEAQTITLGLLLHHEQISNIGSTPATCTEEGITEGQRCDKCNITICGCEKIEALGHNIVNTPDIKPSCSNPGHTPGKYCSTCNLVFVKPIEIEKLPHDYEIIPQEVNASGYGHSEYKKCKVCGHTEGYHEIWMI